MTSVTYRDKGDGSARVTINGHDVSDAVFVDGFRFVMEPIDPDRPRGLTHLVLHAQIACDEVDIEALGGTRLADAKRPWWKWRNRP